MTGEGFAEFVFRNSWFDAYQERLGSRYITFKIALNLFLAQGGRNIVETGSVREPGNWHGDGGSTVLFGEFAKRYGGHLWTCDLDRDVIAMARYLTSANASHITYVVRDSIAFLRNFTEPIDLLYLDSLDCPYEGDAEYAQTHNWTELMAAFPRLSPRAIVLLDDNDHANGGKTARSKRELLDRSWTCVFDQKQSLWIRRDTEHARET